MTYAQRQELRQKCEAAFAKHSPESDTYQWAKRVVKVLDYLDTIEPAPSAEIPINWLGGK